MVFIIPSWKWLQGQIFPSDKSYISNPRIGEKTINGTVSTEYPVCTGSTGGVSEMYARPASTPSMKHVIGDNLT